MPRQVHYHNIPSDILAVFRIIFGLAMVGSVIRYFVKGYVDAIHVDPVFQPYYPWAPWANIRLGVWMHLVFSAIGVFSLFIALGLFYRISIIIFFLLFSFHFLSQAINYLNHNYLICLIAFLMIWIPCGHALSLDAWFKGRSLRFECDVRFLWLLRFIIGLPYVFGGIAKLNLDWMRGQPMAIWLAKRDHWPLIGPFFNDYWVALTYSWGGILFDLLIVPLLLVKRTRGIAILLALGFHTSNMFMFKIGVFPWLMTGALIVFLDPFKLKWLRATGEGEHNFQWRRFHVILFSCFVLFHVTFPFRHWFYTGNPSWTEEGHKFVWHMMLRNKDSESAIFVVDKSKRHIGEINSATILSRRQRRKTLYFPELSRQLASYIRNDIEQQGSSDIEIRMLTLSSLNGRKYQLLIDPSVDLSRVEYEPFKSSDWIVPLYEPFHRGEVDWSKVPERYKKFKIPEYSRETGQIPYREFYIHLMHEMGWEDQLLPEKAEGQFGAGSGEDGAEPKP